MIQKMNSQSNSFSLNLTEIVVEVESWCYCSKGISAFHRLGVAEDESAAPSLILIRS
jgi:hypothetical protein